MTLRYYHTDLSLIQDACASFSPSIWLYYKQFSCGLVLYHISEGALSYSSE